MFSSFPISDCTARMLPADSRNTAQVPQVVMGAITYLGKGTTMGPPATTPVGPCDGP